MLPTSKSKLSLLFLACICGLCVETKLKSAPGSLEAQALLDFQIYRTRIEPIFLKPRPNGTRCYDCHSVVATRFRLEPLAPGSSSWTEEQSRKNFAVVSELITPGDPLKSRLLVHPLAQEAGGDATHTGGKFWTSQDDPEWQMLADLVRHSSSGLPAGPAASRINADALDFHFFKSKVEPIFLKERTGHARCYGCHSEAPRIFRLEKLSPGATDWAEDQSRRNFQNTVQQVVPGDPVRSRFLIHPLAPEAGGDPFHSGGRQFPSQNDPDWLTISDWVRGAQAASDSKPRSTALIYITNSAGDTIDVVDPAINKVVQVIRGIELPHGVNFSSDGKQIFISNESESVLDVVDRESGEIVKRIPLSGRPNNIAVTKDGRRVLVGIRALPGAVDVIDTTSLNLSNTIHLNRSVHNIYVTPDGKYAVAGSIESKSATAIDLQTDRVVWEVKFDSGVRPMTFDTNPDGSTNRIFVQLSNFNGFAVVDFAKHTEVTRIKLPDQPGGFGVAEGRTGTPSHGIGVMPDGKSLWIGSTFANAVFKYELPSLKLLGYVALPEVHAMGRAPSGSVPEWITFTPDSRLLYVSNSAARSVSAIDSSTLKQVAEIPVGEVPKRINTLVLE
jgi:YVTN family beta-propeller protein